MEIFGGRGWGWFVIHSHSLEYIARENTETTNKNYLSCKFFGAKVGSFFLVICLYSALTNRCLSLYTNDRRISLQSYTHMHIYKYIRTYVCKCLKKKKTDKLDNLDRIPGFTTSFLTHSSGRI